MPAPAPSNANAHNVSFLKARCVRNNAIMNILANGTSLSLAKDAPYTLGCSKNNNIAKSASHLFPNNLNARRYAKSPAVRNKI